MSLDVIEGTEVISVQALAAWRAQKIPHAVLDVREDPELAICRIADAIHIPMGQVPARLAEIPADVPLAVLCHHGARSLRVVKFLRQAGRLNAVNLEGGIDAWAEEVDPSVGRY